MGRIDYFRFGNRTLTALCLYDNQLDLNGENG